MNTTQSATTLVDQSFSKATSKAYWHYLAKNCKKESDFALQSIESRVKQIAGVLGENSFQRQEDHGFTPLHVAVITGNTACVRFLLKQNIDTEITDQQEKKAIEYVPKDQPELLDLFSFPYRLKNKLAPVIKPVLDKWLVKLPSWNGCYKQYTDDFGKEIESLLIGKPMPDKEITGKGNQLILSHLGLVCKYLGIKFEFSKTLHHVRDLWVRLHKGNLLTPFISKNQTLAADRSQSHALYFNQKAHTRTQNIYFKGVGGQTLAHHLLAGNSTYKEMNEKEAPVSSHSYFEGGNVLTANNTEGNLKVVIGRDHRLNSLNLNRLEESFKKAHAEIEGLYLKKTISSLTPNKVKKVAEYLYAQGLLKQDGHTGFLDFNQVRKVIQQQYKTSQFQTSVDPKDHSYRKTAEEMGILKPFKWNEEMGKTCKEMVAKYQLQKYLVHRLTAKDFGLDAENVHYASQAAYHLDNFLKPGPNHTMFIQDYQMCAEILQAIYDDAADSKFSEIDQKEQKGKDSKSPEVAKKQKSDQLKLSETDKKHLYRYLLTAKKLHTEIGPLLAKVKEELKKANFITIPMPGNFMYEPEGYDKNVDAPTHNINFINSLSGWSQQRNQYYYITTGGHVGDRLGTILMDSFSLFLQQYVSGIETFFIGRDQHQTENFSEPMGWWNRTNGLAGVHCFTFETATADHK